MKRKIRTNFTKKRDTKNDSLFLAQLNLSHVHCKFNCSTDQTRKTLWLNSLLHGQEIQTSMLIMTKLSTTCAVQVQLKQFKILETYS